MMLDDCGFLDLTLTEQAVQQIFQGIQQNATADDEEENEGVDDDEEMSLSEFLDGLVTWFSFLLFAYCWNRYPEALT